ncbi:MAG: hypothetical protein JWN74_312 [Acidobacteriaceae bacterium]|nr:hypothetical protein [Acidobacteriaceae bacterium]
MNDMVSIKKSVFGSCRGTKPGFAPTEGPISTREAVSVRAAEDLLDGGKKQV